METKKGKFIMGKAQKIKEQRKKIQIEKKERKKRFFKNFFIYSLVGLLSLSLALAGSYIYQKLANKQATIKSYKTGDKMYSQAPDMQIDINKTYIAKFETSMGNFEVELFTKDAPKTVNNFVVLSKDGFYDNLIFHRIIKDFMIQGGDPQGTGSGGPGYKFEDEFNSHKLVRGTLAMANSGPNTNGSQFFIITAEATDWLDGKHTAFGQVTSGLDIVMNMGNVETAGADKPVTEVKINKITIEGK
jgi:cyclophilin family peptidyl-prolyl cis-trans isomerase